MRAACQTCRLPAAAQTSASCVRACRCAGCCTAAALGHRRWAAASCSGHARCHSPARLCGCTLQAHPTLAHAAPLQLRRGQRSCVPAWRQGTPHCWQTGCAAAASAAWPWVGAQAHVALDRACCCHCAHRAGAPQSTGRAALVGSGSAAADPCGGHWQTRVRPPWCGWLVAASGWQARSRAPEGICTCSAAACARLERSCRA
jgi:hypothetical protein